MKEQFGKKVDQYKRTLKNNSDQLKKAGEKKVLKQKKLKLDTHKKFDQIKQGFKDPRKLKSYLDKEGQPDIPTIKKYLASCPLPFLYKFERMKPGTMLAVVCRKIGLKKYIFEPGNDKQNRYIGVACMLRNPKYRTVEIDGRRAERPKPNKSNKKGLVGPFFHRDDTGRLRIYGKILRGQTLKIVDEISKKEAKPLIKALEFSTKEKAAITVIAEKIFPKNKEKQELIFDAARYEGIPPLAFAKMLEVYRNSKPPKHPQGFNNLTGKEPAAQYFKWFARNTAINEKIFRRKVMADGYYTKEFLKFNATPRKYVSARGNIGTGYKRGSSRASYAPSNYRSAANLSPSNLRAMRGHEKHLTPERQKFLIQEITRMEEQAWKNNKTPGFTKGVKNPNSKYHQYLNELQTVRSERLKTSETNRRRIKTVEIACKKYKLPRRFVAIIMATMRYESNYGEVLVNNTNVKSSACGLGQFLWSTWAKFRESVKDDAYYKQLFQSGHSLCRADETIMLHAMAWHYRKSVDYLKRRYGMSEAEALKKMTAEYSYLTYHDGDRGATMVDQYIATGSCNSALLRYSFQYKYQGRYDPQGRTQWITNYAAKVGKLAREGYSEFYRPANTSAVKDNRPPAMSA